MSGLVASQTRCFPLLQGTTVTPSGRFPSARSRPGGSRREGTFAVASDRCMMLFSAPWRWWRPWLRRQLRPCVARASTSKPQCWQVWGLHKGVPRRNPTATLTVWSSMHRPREEIGRASNHAPDSLAEHASRRARGNHFIILIKFSLHEVSDTYMYRYKFLSDTDFLSDPVHCLQQHRITLKSGQAFTLLMLTYPTMASFHLVNPFSMNKRSSELAFSFPSPSAFAQMRQKAESDDSSW